MKSLILAALLALPAAVHSQALCATRDVLVSRLTGQYGEARQSVGIDSNGNLMEIFASLETGGWSVLVKEPTGRSCLVAAGQGFRIDSEPAGIEG